MIIRLRRPPERVNLYTVFSKAVIGYRSLQKKKELELLKVAPGLPYKGMPYRYEPQAKTKIEKLKVERR